MLRHTCIRIRHFVKLRKFKACVRLSFFIAALLIHAGDVFLYAKLIEAVKVHVNHSDVRQSVS